MTSLSASIVLSLFVANVLQIIPMPATIDPFRPDWVLMVAVYWGIRTPSRLSVGVAGLAGFVLDVLYGTILGTHALAMVIAVYIVATNYQRFKNYEMPLQIGVLLALSLVYHLVSFVVQYSFTGLPFHSSYLYPMFSTAVLWPWSVWMLSKLGREFPVS